jgi:hypothetical protein
MNRRILLVIVALGCADCGATPTPSTPRDVELEPLTVAASGALEDEPARALPPEAFVGTFHSTWGRSEFKARGGQVFVTYPLGTMVCDVKREALDCRWREGEDVGRARIRRVSNDRLDGTWGRDQSADNGGSWQFDRARAFERGVFAGDYESTWGPAKLSQQNDIVRGVYERGELSCRARETLLDCTWREGQDAGRAAFEQDADGRIIGTWGRGESATDGGAWTFEPR